MFPKCKARPPLIWGACKIMEILLAEKLNALYDHVHLWPMYEPELLMFLFSGWFRGHSALDMVVCSGDLEIAIWTTASREVISRRISKWDLPFHPGRIRLVWSRGWSFWWSTGDLLIQTLRNAPILDYCSFILISCWDQRVGPHSCGRG